MSKTEKIIAFILFGIAFYFPIFLHLDHGALYRWDEATNALHAYDMLQNGHYLRRFFLGNPETWETKPMLFIWLQAISMKIFGFNELGARLPSAFAVLGTIGLIIRFFCKELKNLWGGLFSAIVLLTSAGYVRGHVSRTADHDALLLFFLIGGFIYFYKFLNGAEEKKKRHLWFFVCFLICGVLTKSIAGLYYAPGLLVLTIVSKNFIPTIQNKHFWLTVFSFFVVVGGYYFSTEYFYPGYLELVWNNELFPRFSNSSSTLVFNKMPEPYHFTKILFTNNFKYYAWFIPMSILLAFIQKDKALLKFISATTITALIFHVVISNGTYNSWYNAPVFPLLAIIVGTGISIIFNTIKKHFELSHFKFGAFAFVFIISIFFFPYKDIILNKCYFKEHWASDDIYGEYFEKLRKRQPELKRFHVYYEVINRHFLFYESVYNQQHGYEITSCGAGANIKGCKGFRIAKLGDKVMICNDGIKKAFHERYEAKAIDGYKACEMFEISALKE